MTSVIAIKTNSGVEGVVLGTDTQINYYDKDGKLSTKANEGVSKILSGEKWMMSYTGSIDTDAFYRFTRIMEGDKRFLSKDRRKDTPGKIVRRAIENYLKDAKNYDGPHFKEVNDLNTRAMREGENLEDIPTFVLAAHFERRVKGLWYVDEFGNLVKPRDYTNEEDTNKEFDYISIGSGGGDIEKYIEKEVFDRKIQPKDIGIQEAAKIVFSSLCESTKDPSTGHLKDIAILTKVRVVRYGDSFKKELFEAEKKVEDGILRDCASLKR